MVANILMVASVLSMIANILMVAAYDNLALMLQTDTVTSSDDNAEEEQDASASGEQEENVQDDSGDIDSNSGGNVTCKICYSSSCNIFLVPCGHLLCNPCVLKVNRCPFCRKHIIRTYNCFM